MGYTHGTKFSEERIIDSLKIVMEALKIETMPSRSQIEFVLKNSSVTNAISKNGGFAFWSVKLGLELKDSESKTGKLFESTTEFMIQDKCGLETSTTSTKHPYDLVAGNFVKIDVKSGRIYNYNGFDYWSFNLEKVPATCDIYICHCLDKNDNIEKTLIIPSILCKKNQLSIGKKSFYDKYIDRWDYVNKYHDFLSSVN